MTGKQPQPDRAIAQVDVTFDADDLASRYLLGAASSAPQDEWLDAITGRHLRRP